MTEFTDQIQVYTHIVVPPASDYWWSQRLADATFDQGRLDREAGVPVRSTDIHYQLGYHIAEEDMNG